MFSRSLILTGIGFSFLLVACNKNPSIENAPKATDPNPVVTTKPQKPKTVLPTDNNASNTKKNPNELRVEHRDGGIFIVNNAQKGKIVHSDGGVLLVLEEKPSKEEPSEPEPTVPHKTIPVTKSDPNAGMADKIKDYFFVMDNFQAGPVGVKPRKFAEKLLANMAKNNNEDLDNLMSGMKDIRTKMKAIEPPEPCVDYHRLSIELLDGSMSMMDDLASAVKSNNKDQLNALVTKATLLKAKTKKLEKLRAAIEKRFKLTNSY